MFIKTLSLILTLLLTVVSSRQICYENHGCFIDTKPFSGTIQRPLAFLPESPQKISTSFQLYTRENQFNAQLINTTQIGGFNSALPTKLYVHGFRHNGLKDYVLDTKDAILTIENANFIAVDWSKGNGLPYTQATANTQIVGSEIAILINHLITNYNAKAVDFHCIGHSLGSHICGYAGQRVVNLGRITGLDPAGPYFENTDPIVRLDPTDAQFVDVIHSDGTANLQLGLGLFQSVGHIDYFPNGGLNQPDCPTTSGKLLNAIFNAASFDIDSIEAGIACSHWAAIYFFLDSIQNDCKYTAYPCTSKDEFDKGNCLKCLSGQSCNRLGYYASKNADLGDLYLNTQSPTAKPYCKQNLKVTLFSNSLSEMSQTKGKFTFFFQTKHHISTTEVLDDSSTVFKKNSEEDRFISLTSPVYYENSDDSIENVFVSFTKTSSFVTSWLYDSKWSFKFIQIFTGDDQALLKFCPAVSFMESGSQTYLFKKC